MSQGPDDPPFIKVIKQFSGIEPGCHVGDDPEDEEDGGEWHSENIVYIFDCETEGHHADPGEHPVDHVAGGPEVVRKGYVPHDGEGEVEEGEKEVEEWED